MASLNFITSNSVPEIQNKIMRQSAADKIEDEQALRSRYDFDQKVRGAKALNAAINSIQARQNAAPVSSVPQPSAEPVAVPELTEDAASPIAQESAYQPPANAGQRVASPISTVAARPSPKLTRQDLIGALGTDASTAPQRFHLMQQDVAHNEQQDQLRRQESNKAADRVWELAKTNDPANLAQARALAQQHGIAIPEEFWTNKNSRARTIGIIDTMHRLGLRGDQIPAAFKNLQTAKGANDDEKLIDAVSRVPAGLAWNPSARGSSGGGAASTGGVEGWKFSMWQQSNPGGTYEQYRKFIQGPKADVRARLIMNAMKAKDALGVRPLYKSQEEAAAAVDAALGESGAPTAAPAPTAKPATRIRFDAQGNRIQ